MEKYYGIRVLVRNNQNVIFGMSGNYGPNSAQLAEVVTWKQLTTSCSIDLKDKEEDNQSGLQYNAQNNNIVFTGTLGEDKVLDCSVYVTEAEFDKISEDFKSEGENSIFKAMLKSNKSHKEFMSYQDLVLPTLNIFKMELDKTQFVTEDHLNLSKIT